MKKTIGMKLIFGYVLFCILGFITVSSITSRLSLKQIQENEVSGLYKEAHLIASDYAVSYYSDNITLEDFKTRLKALDTYLSARIWVVSANGNILVNSAKSIDSSDMETIPDFNIGAFNSRYCQVGTFYDRFDESQLSVYAPISINYKVKGYVILHKPMRLLYAEHGGFLKIAYITLALIFLGALLPLALFVFTFVLPFRKITKAAHEYASGKFERPVNVHSNDDIGYLAASLTYMATELNTLEEDQRKFVSNVSHDFRSPLTSIKGYVEAILDGTIPAEYQEKYLNIILFETERLNKLTASLLELNDYGKRAGLLNIAKFDINHMIKMTAQTFEGICKEKRISFELILTGQTLFALADMDKIQRVIYNLIDNAIKFSHADSVITVETTVKNEKIFVAVKDKGIGIPKESLGKIWERFYKTDLSRGKDKKGTGLGLAIVKEIIQSHQENINVISTEGVGTEFIFSLPLYQPEED